MRLTVIACLVALLSGAPASADQPLVVSGNPASADQPLVVSGNPASADQPLVVSGNPASADQPLVVIAHPSRASQMSADEIERIYLKRQRYWKDGKPVVPINREAASTPRQRFDRKFLGSAKLDLIAYWNQRYFHGVFPPATLESDEAIKRYVASDPNALGYIAADRVDDSVIVVNRPD